MNTNTTKPAQCRFDELEDGEHFILAMTLAFGSNRVMQKVLEESDKYNAVWMENTNRSELIPADTQVVRVRDTTIIKPDVEDNTLSIDAFTMVMLKTSMYMFKDMELEGNEWIGLQEDDSIYTVPLPNERLAMLVNQRGEYCFIFWDEADQCSQPYPTVQDAKQAYNAYMAHL